MLLLSWQSETANSCKCSIVVYVSLLSPALALLSAALLVGAALSQDVAAGCNAQCAVNCDASLSLCVDVPPLNNCAKDKEDYIES